MPWKLGGIIIFENTELKKKIGKRKRKNPFLDLVGLFFGDFISPNKHYIKGHHLSAKFRQGGKTLLFLVYAI